MSTLIDYLSQESLKPLQVQCFANTKHKQYGMPQKMVCFTLQRTPYVFFAVDCLEPTKTQNSYSTVLQ